MEIKKTKHVFLIISLIATRNITLHSPSQLSENGHLIRPIDCASAQQCVNANTKWISRCGKLFKISLIFKKLNIVHMETNDLKNNEMKNYTPQIWGFNLYIDKLWHDFVACIYWSNIYCFNHFDYPY